MYLEFKSYDSQIDPAARASQNKAVKDDWTMIVTLITLAYFTT